MADNLSKILNNIRPDINSNNWTEILENIKTHIKNFDDAQRSPSRHNREDLLAYLNEILPTYWDVFHTHNTHRRRIGELLKRGDDETLLPTYKIGIFLVGYSSLPIALSLAEIQPTEQVYFLYSSDTKDYLNEISERLSAMLNGSNKELLDLVENTVLHNLTTSSLKIDDPSDPVSTFKRIKEIIDNIDDADNKRIALDLTGGKKTMLGGGYTAGAIWTSRWSDTANKLVHFCDMYYIDSKEYDPSQGSPVPGTEFLSQLVNPYDVYNVQSNQQARKLFEKHNYEAAANLWEDVKNTLEKHASRYSLDTEKKKTVNQHRMANCYYLWDSFDYDKANKAKERHKNSWEYSEIHVKDSIDVLDILSEVKNKTSLFACDARVIHYAVDRYQNGMRRKESGKLEDAIVRFAQVIEMICNYRIYRLSQDNYFVGMKQETQPRTLKADKKWEFGHLIGLLFGTSREEFKGVSYYVSSDKQMAVENYNCDNVGQIIAVIQPRNDFIHFNIPQRQKRAKTDTEKLRKLAHKFLENFLDDYCNNYLSLDDLLELHRFRGLTE